MRRDATISDGYLVEGQQFMSFDATGCDTVSVDLGSTNNDTPTVLGWGFFLPERAGSRVFAGIPAEACGLRRSAHGPVQGHLPLSPCRFSLRPRSLELAR